jgi:zinc transporter, ZIP family
MTEAMAWSLLGASSLLLGALAAFFLPIGKRLLGMIMAFGAGVLISAVAFDLTEEALELGGGPPVGAGLAAGALVYYLGDRVLRARRPRGGGADAEDPQGIVLGALLDGIPESAAIGLTLITGGSVSGSFVAAVFISNLPESISASAELRPKYKASRILGVWLAIAVASAIAAGVGYAVLQDASGDAAAFVKAFAGGAILCMLANTMMPQAFRDGGDRVGLVTVLGFSLAALLSEA